VTLENGPTTLNFTDNGQAVDAFGGFSSFWGLAATATTLYAPIPPTNGGATGLSLGSPFFPGATSGAQGPTVSWYFSDFTPNTSFSGVNPQTGYFWRVTGSSLNSFDWVIGTASANVPEPTGLELAGLGVLGLIVFSIRQRQYTKAAV
jgi:hypothetical protein